MPHVPIVLYTLYDDAHTEAEAKKVGIRRVISKTKPANPVADLEELLGKPHHIGPLSVTDEYAIEPIRNEETAASEPTKPIQERRLRD